MFCGTIVFASHDCHARLPKAHVRLAHLWVHRWGKKTFGYGWALVGKVVLAMCIGTKAIAIVLVLEIKPKLVVWLHLTFSYVISDTS